MILCEKLMTAEKASKPSKERRREKKDIEFINIDTDAVVLSSSFASIKHLIRRLARMILALDDCFRLTHSTQIQLNPFQSIFAKL